MALNLDVLSVLAVGGNVCSELGVGVVGLCDRIMCVLVASLVVAVKAVLAFAPTD